MRGVSDQPPTRVYTGAAEEGRRGLRSLLVALLGWLLWAGLIAWLATHASEDALDAALFLVTIIVTVALLLVLTGAGLLRPTVMRERARAPAPARRALERPLPSAEAPAELTGEIGVELRDGERRYVSLGSEAP
jgi:hypothetical protein